MYKREPYSTSFPGSFLYFEKWRKDPGNEVEPYCLAKQKILFRWLAKEIWASKEIWRQCWKKDIFPTRTLWLLMLSEQGWLEYVVLFFQDTWSRNLRGNSSKHKQKANASLHDERSQLHARGYNTKTGTRTTQPREGKLKTRAQDLDVINCSWFQKRIPRPAPEATHGSINSIKTVGRKCNYDVPIQPMLTGFESHISKKEKMIHLIF